MIRTALLTTTLLLAPALVFAAGSDTDASPPKETATTTECQGTQVWDTKTETCVDAQQDSLLDDDARYHAVRELAYGGAYDRALGILDSFADPNDDRRLTYLGFVARKMGDLDTGMGWYQAALAINPDNLMARSYMGQALLQMGDRDGAQAQLTQIRARGGRQTWPEVALNMALRDGPSPAY